MALDTRSASFAPQTPARPASEWSVLRPILAFFAVQIFLRTLGIAAPSFAFAFVAIAWSGRSAGFAGRVLTAGACAVWVYAISPTSVAITLTPLQWLTFGGLEALGLLAVAKWRRRAEARHAAVDSQQAYRALVQANAAVIWRAGAEGRLIEFTGWEKLTGRSAPAFSREEWRQQIHPDDWPSTLAAWERASRLAEPVAVECRLRTHDGPPVHVRISGVPLTDADGRVREWIGTVVDIREQKALEEAFRRKELELTTLVDAVPGLVFYIDRNYRYVFNNEAFRTWFGLDPHTLRGSAVEGVIGPEAFARVKPEIDRALGGEGVHFESLVPYQHGGSRWIEAHLTPHRAGNGEVCGCVGLVHDIAERKQREKEHADALAGYRFLADAMPQIVWTAQPAGKTDYINWRWFHLTGQSLSGVSTDAWLDAVHPDDREMTRVGWARARKHGEPYEMQHRIRRASDGRYLWHLSRAVPRRDANGNVVQWVGSSTDIDLQCRAYAELAEAREQLRRHAAGLEERIRERTASLEEAIAELRILTSSVSHDLRTPLHIVQTFVDEITADRGNHLSPESAELLARVGHTTRRMSALMQDLLSYTGISHGSQHIRAIALGEVVNEVLDQQRDAIRNSGASVTVEKPLLAVLADHTSTFQVVSNLVSNALKFASPGRPLELRIRTEATLPRVRLWVEDNGIGIDGCDQERIFRLFERLDGARSRPGNGVGLALVRKAMTRMGGSSGVVSQPGHGSRFWVEFEAPANVAKPGSAK